MGLAEELAKKYAENGTLEIADNGGTRGAWFVTYNHVRDVIREALEFAAQEAEKECADLGERAVGFHVAARIRKLKE